MEVRASLFFYPVGLTNLEQVLSQSHPDSICLDNLNPRTPSCIGMSLWPSGPLAPCLS